MAPSAAEDWELPLSSDFEDAIQFDAPQSDRLNKRDCERCERPHSVCLCPALPPVPLKLAGQVIILQHPHERKKRLATVPVLEKCVAPGCLHVLHGRAYRPGYPPHAALQAALAGAAEGRHPLLVLFPGAGARDVREVGAELRAASLAAAVPLEAPAPFEGQQKRQQQQQQHPGDPAQAAQHSGLLQSSSLQQGGRQRGFLQGRCVTHGPAQQQQQQQQQQDHGPAQQAPPPPQRQHCERHPLYVLFVIDGTWQQAKEMFKVAAAHVLPPSGPGFRVQLPPPAAQGPAASLQGAEAASGQQQQQQMQPQGQHSQRQQQPQWQDQRWQQQQERVQPQPLEEEEDERQHLQQQGQPQPQGQVEQGQAAAGGELGGPLLIRMEPLEGCLTTCEAVARALGALEPGGEAVQAAILRPLAQLAHYQAQFDPSTAARLAEARIGYSQSRKRMGLSRQRDLSQIR